MVFLPALSPRPLASDVVLNGSYMSPRAWRTAESQPLPMTAPALQPRAAPASSTGAYDDFDDDPAKMPQDAREEASDGYPEPSPEGGLRSKLAKAASANKAERAFGDLRQQVRDQPSTQVAEEIALSTGELSAARACQVRI